MDRVRFGRALGFGARQAVKTLVTAVDAATAENPSAKNTAPKQGSSPAATMRVSSQSVAPHASSAAARTAPGPVRTTANNAARTVAQGREMQKGLKRGGRQFGKAVWGPFVRLSGVLWLEVSGVFFGMFALIAAGYLWKLRGAWHGAAATEANHRSLMGALVMLVVFGYFCISNFVRAKRRERGR